LKALIFASVLHLRSKALVPQPVETNEGNILAFNGELYSGVEGLDVKDVSDTKILSNLLRGAEDEAGVSDVFCHVRGEFAFVFYHARTRRLWFGRDRLGRRSLLWRRSVEGELDLVSVAKRGKDWEEVPTLGIFSLPLVSEPKALSSTLTLHRWCAEADSATDQAMFHSGTPINIPPLYERNNLRILPEAIPWEKETPFAEISSLIDSTVNSFETVLRTAVRRRVCNIPDLGDRVPKLAVLFSGGLDCTVLAYLAATSLSDGVLIDLINVAFENPRALAAKANGTTSKEAIALPDEVKYCVPDRVTARQSYANLIAALPRSSFRLVEVNVPYTEVEEQRAHILDLMAPSATVMDLVGRA
jgi:asparagine synthetase B (glutamine-hydrolysing)